MTTGLLFGQLVHHHGCLVDDYLILVVEKFDQLWDGACGKVCIILEKDTHTETLAATTLNHILYQQNKPYLQTQGFVSYLSREDYQSHSKSFFPPHSRSRLGNWSIITTGPQFHTFSQDLIFSFFSPAMCNCSNHYLDVQCSLYTDLKQQSSTRHQLLLSLSLLSLFNSQSQLFHCIAHSVVVNSTVFSCSSDDQTDGKDQGLQLSHSH